METFTAAREFVDNPRFAADREAALAELATLEPGAIDAPIVDLVAAFAGLPHCYTLQCCYGHFLYSERQGEHGLERLPQEFSDPVRYRIAYVAVVVENSARGAALRESLAAITTIDPEYVQFGSADWFWERWVNSYALQVEPAAHMFEDQAVLDAGEAIHVQCVRDEFFVAVGQLVASERDDL